MPAPLRPKSHTKITSASASVLVPLRPEVHIKITPASARWLPVFFWEDLIIWGMIGLFWGVLVFGSVTDCT